MMRDQPSNFLRLRRRSAGLREQRRGDRRPLQLLPLPAGRAVLALRFVNADIMQESRSLQNILFFLPQALASS